MNIPIKTYDTIDKLVEACMQHDRLAQKILYERYAKSMMGVCLRYCGDYDTALDILHNGFIIIFEKIKNFRNEGYFEGWMRKIFVNESLTYLRKKNALRNTLDIDEIEVFDTNYPDAIDNLSAQEIIDKINLLPIGARTIFNLYAIEGYSHAEIGQMLHINEASSRSQFQRARMHLQKLILNDENLKQRLKKRMNLHE